jgi:molybdopterin-containing oxidoreductase family iron-sulfur binding subunit
MENKIENHSQSFTPPRHWVGLEELDSKYWDDPRTMEKRGQEFFDKPVETLDAIDKSAQGGLARRDFLTIMGASMAMATFACARRPVHKIIPYVVNPEGVVPGIPILYASTSKECPHGCGILIKTREGRPVKLEGNPDHPVNKGKLCAQAQASVLNLYDVDRLKGAAARDRNGGALREISWSDADNAISTQLKKSRGVRVLTDEMRSDSTARLIREFLSASGGGEHVQYEPLALDEVAEAQNLSYGAAVMPRYRFDQADVVVSLGMDFLGSGRNAVENAADWAKRRKVVSPKDGSTSAKMSKLFCFESAFTITGANADRRHPIRPGDETKIALAIANELKGEFPTYKADAVEQEIGLEKGTIKEVARALRENHGRALVVGGSVQSRTKDALALQLAINYLNSALDAEGNIVDGVSDAASAVPGLAGMTKLINEMKSGAVGALIIYRSNPVFTLPNAGFAEALKKVPLVVYVGDHDTETAQLADFVLGDHHYLENWGDWSPRKGVYSLQQPAIAPIHGTRAFEDSLIAWSKVGGGKDWHGYLQENWKETVFKESGATGGFDMFWEGALRSGVIDLRAARMSAFKAAPRSFRPASVAQMPKYSVASNDVQLALTSSIAMMDGRYANNPWLQELPDPISSATWDNYLAVGPALAASLAVKNDDVVLVKSGNTSVELPVYVQPGLHPQTVTVAVGYGRRNVGKVGDGAGVDVFPFASIEGGRVVYSGHPVTITRTQKFYKLATTQWHTVSENRPVINDVTLAEFKKNAAAAQETNPELRMEKAPSLWPVHQYKGYRWGMAIDLNSCIGCSACMVGCQAENNIPVVGRDQVRVSRQMHWIRIDRYYTGTAENPDVLFQPMLCQHCENAPCETVCPVLATVHDDEGLNVQVYNRCVGTRYCQNNCPYKVRRFNFFDHWKSYTGTMNLAWNPDVTVRTRGIMEKCTFCVQRITAAKDSAKDRGEIIKDGEFKTACQQTCPTDAIVFGNINDPESSVSRLREAQSAFRVLEALNTGPSISYMTKVRNKGAEQHV